MKKLMFIRLAIIACFVAVTSACSPTTTNVVNQGISIAQQAESTAQTVLSTAELAWPLIVPFIPAANLPTVQADFTADTLAANKALMVLSDAIAAAQATNQPNPDFSAAIKAVVDAVSQVLSIVNQFKSPPAPAVAPSVLTSYSPSADLAVLKRVAHVQ